jgi:hypothetical protein
LADLGQRAFNASNHAVSVASELEFASNVAAFGQTLSGEAKWDACIEAALQSQPPCKEYGRYIGMYVESYSGGPGAPLISFLDQFCKEYGENRRLGSEMWQALAEFEMSDVNTCVFTRAGIIAACLIGSKVQDGYARSLDVACVRSLRHKDKQEALLLHEKMLGDAWSALKSVGEVSCSAGTFTATIGVFFVRATLHLLGKEKFGFETHVYNSPSEIKDLFAKELMAKLPPGTVPARYTFATTPVATPAGRVSGMSLDEASDPIWLAAQKGFIANAIICEKDVPGLYYFLNSGGYGFISRLGASL